MKKLRYILGTSLVLSSLIASPVMAVSTPATDVVSEPVQKPTTTSAESKPVTTAASTATVSTDPALRAKRLEELKMKLKVKLDDATMKKIVLKCKPAQTIVEGAEKIDTSNGLKRGNAYKKISTSVQDLITKLNANNVDVTSLETAATMLNQKIAIFNTDLTSYQQTHSDLRTLDCAIDPTAFQTALVATRTAREKVRTDAVDIHDFVKVTLKPALEAVKAQLQATKTNATKEGSQ